MKQVLDNFASNFKNKFNKEQPALEFEKKKQHFCSSCATSFYLFPNQFENAVVQLFLINFALLSHNCHLRAS